MAFSRATGQLAVGGFGTRGYLGDIAWLDPDSGRFLRAKYEHTSTIESLSYSRDGRWLASVDFGGRVLLWGDANAAPREIWRADADVYDAETRRAIRAIDPNLYCRRLTFAGNRFLAVGVCTGRTPDQKLIWKIRLFDVPTGRPGRTLEPDHVGLVKALASSADGRWLSSADLDGRIHLWDLSAADPWGRRIAENVPVQSLGLGPAGEVLVVGTFAPDGQGSTELQVRDVPSGAVRRTRRLDDTVTACAVSPDAERLAYTGGSGHEVFVEWLHEPYEVWAIPGGEQVDAVTFGTLQSAHQVLLRSRAGRRDPTSFRVFDPVKLTLRAYQGQAREPVFSQSRGSWSAVADPQNRFRMWFAQAGQRQCTSYIDLDPSEQGTPQCWCWIEDRAGEPYAVAVGTDVQHGVYVYGLTDAGACPLLRYFRGHSGMVNSLALSPDGRYLASGSADGTVRYWNLESCRSPSHVYRRWGVEFGIEGGRTVVRQIDELGPLYSKGIRRGDLLDKIAWPDANGNRDETRPQRLLGTLASLPWQTQVVFSFLRGGKPLEGFQSVAGWYPLLSVYVTKRDWIAWTTDGYYACSAGGERLIGWQVNHGLGEAPSFFTADQFNKTLFRKDVIRVLLEKGSVSKALARTEGQGVQPAPVPASVVEVLPPKVTILSPAEHRVEQTEPQILVTARAEAAAGQPIVAMSLLLDGRPYEAARLVKGIVRERMTRTETWQVELTPGLHTIAVKAESEKSEGLSEVKEVFYDAPPPKPSLFVLAVGISAYPGNLRLNFAHTDALSLGSVLKANTAGLFDVVETRSLVNEEATQDAIKDGLEWLRHRTGQGDIALFFYSGHGMNDCEGEFYLVPVDADAEKPEKTCISSSHLREFCAKTRRCRLVMLLDACHSGGLNLCRFLSITEAVEDMAREMGRNDYGVVVLASSCGEETSLELDEIQAGAFTKALIEGLEGKADADGDHLILVPMEAHSYTWRRVRELTEQKQTPINSNTGVKDFPLTRVSQSGVASR
jgi:WD40 repeat protein